MCLKGFLQVFLSLIFLRPLHFSWKDPNNDFKKTLKLTGVPTLLKYGTVRVPSSLQYKSIFLKTIVFMVTL